MSKDKEQLKRDVDALTNVRLEMSKLREKEDMFERAVLNGRCEECSFPLWEDDVDFCDECKEE